jgi:ATP-binding cassette, subfamily B, bacterial HlyB/CyaB
MASHGIQLEGSSILAALATVASSLGLEASVEQLAHRYSSGARSPGHDRIVAIAQDMGLQAREITIRLEELARLQSVLPALLKLTDGNVLILERLRDDPISGLVAILRDPTTPADALIALDAARLNEVWAGDLVLVKRRYAINDELQPFGMAWLMAQVFRERRIFLEIAAASIIGTIFALAPPFLSMIIIDRVLVNHSMATLIVIFTATLILIAFEMALGWVRRFFMEAATTRIDARLNLYVLERLLSLPMDYFERNPTGSILSKLARVAKIRGFLTGQLFGAFLDAFPLLGLVPALLILDWRLAFLVFAFAGLIFLIVLFFLKPLGRRFKKVVATEQAKSAHLVETIQGMKTIKSLALEGRRRHEWDLRVAQATIARHDLGRLSNYPQTLSLPFDRLMYSGTFALGAFLVIAQPDSLHPGALVAFSMLSMRLGQPLVKLAGLAQDVAEIRGDIAEVASVMNAPPEQGRSADGLRSPVRGAISFQNVRFRYAPDAPFALDGARFEIAPGSMLGIMGRSGSGKTTVTRLLQGLNPSYEGLIKIDGMDLREINLTHLRTSIGVVPQENFLFSGTIRDNIAMARPDAPFSAIVRAAQLAGAEEFIERLPRGFETRLEEGATNLSGGQRQRLALARALLIDPPVLVLDEATSALDAESEAIVNANLQRIRNGRTVICISHRLSMLVPADNILVLERGAVYDCGKHEELLQRCDIYRHLWFTQNRHIDRSNPHVSLSLVRSAQA